MPSLSIQRKKGNDDNDNNSSDKKFIKAMGHEWFFVRDDDVGYVGIFIL